MLRREIEVVVSPNCGVEGALDAVVGLRVHTRAIGDLNRWSRRELEFGTCNASGIEPGIYEFAVAIDHWRGVATATIATAPPTQIVVVDVDWHCDYAGQVLNIDGKPAVGCLVAIRGVEAPWAQALTATNGRFVVAAVGQRGVLVDVRTAGGAVAWSGELRPGDTNELRLGR